MHRAGNFANRSGTAEVQGFRLLKMETKAFLFSPFRRAPTLAAGRAQQLYHQIKQENVTMNNASKYTMQFFNPPSAK